MLKFAKLLTVPLVLFSLSSFASKTDKVVPMPKTKPKAVSKVDLKTSTFRWTGTKKIGDKHYGPIKLKSADIMVKDNKVVNGEFVMDMTTIDSDDMKGSPYKKKLVDHLKDPDFFNVQKFPAAKLVITSLGKENTAKGQLTIKGKTLPITIPYTQKDNQFTGKMTFDRTKYGITYSSANFFKKLADKKIINNDVTVDFVVNLK